MVLTTFIKKLLYPLLRSDLHVPGQIEVTTTSGFPEAASADLAKDASVCMTYMTKSLEIPYY